MDLRGGTLAFFLAGFNGAAPARARNASGPGRDIFLQGCRASTGPRPRGRGMLASSMMARATVPCFNGAAPARARNERIVRWPVGVVGASTGPRPRGRGMNCNQQRRRTANKASTGPRPRGRGMKFVPDGANSPKGASTGPRPRGRGMPAPRPAPRPSPRPLQRGRARAGAE